MSERRGVRRCQFEAGILAYGLIKQVANYGRALGLDVQLFDSGLLIKRGWLVASGEEHLLNLLDAAMDDLKEQAMRWMS